MPAMEDAIIAMRGALVMGCFVAALFFARYWRLSRDRFYGFFTAAMVLLRFRRGWPFASEVRIVFGGGEFRGEQVVRLRCVQPVPDEAAYRCPRRRLIRQRVLRADAGHENRHRCQVLDDLGGTQFADPRIAAPRQWNLRG